MTDIETTVQLEEAKASRGNIPTGLSFEEVIKNRPLPPCSLNDFMDYLFYVEQSAENLQFFLWYRNYVQRWSALVPRQKALSPAWDPERAGEPPAASRFIRYSHRRATSDKLNKIMSIMEIDQSRRASEGRTGRHGRQNSTSTNYSRLRASSSTAPITNPADAKEDRQPLTIQPFRGEATRIVKHYIAECSPRQLHLSQEDRDACLHAISHTTHPSALLPAFVAAEAALRARSHPAFISRSASNAAKPRLAASAALGVLLAVLGLALDALLVISRLDRFLRVLCVPLWWPGATVAVAACGYRLCLILRLRNLRQMWPWELLAPDEDEHAPDRRGTARARWRKDRAGASAVPADPLRKPSLQTFGPRNERDAGAWRTAYAARSLYARIFEDAVPIQNQSVRAMQDRAVFLSVAWGGLAATLLAVASLYVPERE